MKENGINKLIKLLNEYAKVLGIGNHIGWHNRKTVENSDFIFTKKFGFIKWLVQNNKIDRHNVKETDYGWDFSYYWTIPNSKRNKEIQVERLLMILSIQDNPIELLVNILK